DLLKMVNTPEQQTNPNTTKEEGATPIGPIENLSELVKGGASIIGNKLGLDLTKQGTALGPLSGLSSIQTMPQTEKEVALQAALPMAAEGLGTTAKAVSQTKAGKAA